MLDGRSAHDSRRVALDFAEEATDVGMSLTALVYALIYVGDSVRVAAGLNAETEIH